MHLLCAAACCAAACCAAAWWYDRHPAAMNEFTIIFFISIGSYQALCNIVRVYNFKTSTLPAKVRSMRHMLPALCVGW
jgi:hypothetical protein